MKLRLLLSSALWSLSLAIFAGFLVLLEQRSNPGGLEQQKCIVSQTWRLEIQDQGISKVSERCRRRMLSRLFQFLIDVPWFVAASSWSLSLSSRGLLPVSSHLPAAHVPPCVQISPFVRTPVILDSAHNNNLILNLLAL